MMRRSAQGLSALAFGQTLLGSATRASGAPSTPGLTDATAKALRRAKASSKGAADIVLDARQEKLAKLLLAKGRHAAALAASSPSTKFPGKTMHAAAARYVQRAGKKRRKKATSAATKLLEASAAKKAELFGDYAHATVASATTTPAVDVKLSELLRNLAEHASAPKEGSGAKFENIEFHLNSLECIEETDEVGADAILLSGQLIAPSGKIIEIAKFTAGDDFDKGDRRWFDWELCSGVEGTALVDQFEGLGMCPHGSAKDPFRGRKLASSKLEGPWPGSWTLILLMGEEDDGGFGDLVEEFYAAMKKEIGEAIEALGDAAAGAIGGAIGGIAGSWAGPIGSAIGAVIGFVVGKVIEWFVGLFDNKDDLVAVESWTIELENATKAYIKGRSEDDLEAPKGVWASPMKKIDFVGDGGRYQARLHWRASS
jgi:hypothetical protein